MLHMSSYYIVLHTLPCPFTEFNLAKAEEWFPRWGKGVKTMVCNFVIVGGGGGGGGGGCMQPCCAAYV